MSTVVRLYLLKTCPWLKVFTNKQTHTDICSTHINMLYHQDISGDRCIWGNDLVSTFCLYFCMDHCTMYGDKKVRLHVKPITNTPSSQIRALIWLLVTDILGIAEKVSYLEQLKPTQYYRVLMSDKHVLCKIKSRLRVLTLKLTSFEDIMHLWCLRYVVYYFPLRQNFEPNSAL